MQQDVPARVWVESLVFALVEGKLQYGVARSPWLCGATPQEALLKPAGPGECKAYEHSTSWRSDGPRSIILTFAIVPSSGCLSRYLRALNHDLCPLSQPPLEEAEPRKGPDTDSNFRTIPDISVGRVAWHAARHLSFLARDEGRWPVASWSADANFWDAIRALPHDLAGEVS